MTEKILPQIVVRSSIGKECPFFKEISKKIVKNEIKPAVESKNEFDITI